MQIVIDTQKDSKEDIRKAAAFLSSLSDGVKEHHSNIFESSGSGLGSSETPAEPTNAFANMFGGENKDMVDETPILGSGTEEKEESEEEAPSTIVQY